MALRNSLNFAGGGSASPLQSLTDGALGKGKAPDLQSAADIIAGKAPTGLSVSGLSANDLSSITNAQSREGWGFDASKNMPSFGELGLGFGKNVLSIMGQGAELGTAASVAVPGFAIGKILSTMLNAGVENVTGGNVADWAGAAYNTLTGQNETVSYANDLAFAMDNFGRSQDIDAFGNNVSQLNAISPSDQKTMDTLAAVNGVTSLGADMAAALGPSGPIQGWGGDAGASISLGSGGGSYGGSNEYGSGGGAYSGYGGSGTGSGGTGAGSGGDGGSGRGSGGGYGFGNGNASTSGGGGGDEGGGGGGE